MHRNENNPIITIDVLLHNGNSLPTQYLTKKEAKKLGWKPILMNLHQVTDKGVIME